MQRIFTLPARRDGAQGSACVRACALVSVGLKRLWLAAVGVEWTYGVAQAHWQARAEAHLVALDDVLVLIGGWAQDAEGQRTYLADVWVTQQRCHKARALALSVSKHLQDCFR